MSIGDNIAGIRQEIADACQRSGRNPAEVRLVAVSKTVGLSEVASAIAAGQHDFGENRSSLLLEKSAAYPGERWHFIGRIQTNKLKDIVGRACLIHSLASERALIAVDRRAELAGISQDVLLEVNVSGELSKDGLAPDEVDALLHSAASMAHVRVQGLMTMAPLGDLAAARKAFAALHQLRDGLAAAYNSCDNICLKELSMGMSDDYPIAVEEGATIIRVGRSVWA